MKASNVLLSIGVIFAGVVFQSLGIVSGWANMLTIAGAVIILLALQKIPQVKFNAASWIFLVWFMISVGLGMTWKQVSEKAPLTSEALSMRSEQADIVYGERIRPKALNELTAMSVFTEEAAKRRAIEIIQEMSKAHARFLNGNITKEEYDVQMVNFTAEAKRNKEWREHRSSEILSLDSNPHDKTLQERLEEVGNTPGRVVMWGLTLILLAAMAFSAWKSKAVMKYAICAVVLIAAVFAIDRFAYGDAGSKIGNWSPASSASASTLANSEIKLDINPTTWSDWRVINKLSNCNTPGWVEFQFGNEDGQIIRNNGDGTFIRKLHGRSPEKLSRFPDPIPSRRLRIRGEAGMAIIG